MNVEVNHPKLSVNFGAERVYPELEDLEVTPTNKEQNFKSSKYGFNNVKVNAIDTKAIGFPLELDLKNVGEFVEINLTGKNVFSLKDNKTAIISVIEENKISIEEKEKAYQELDYIEFTGTQYINTNIPIFNYNNFKIDLDFTPTLTKDSVILGTFNGSNKYESWYDIYGNSAIRYNNTEIKAKTLTTGRRVLLTFEKIGNTVNIYANGELKVSKTVTTSLFNSPLLLFCRTGNSSMGTVKLYSAKLYGNNNELLASYKPVKFDKPCLYDEVSKTFLYNAGTGDFLYG